ncbi:NADPH-dependent FMN reductase [Rouxiella sp. Mn2063]|uniref:NADPH-dependent FMN reductase n=1 Tax=Rouxiella sp. Mn2063 TaxID=3395262 RepID=UPI003BE8529E
MSASKKISGFAGSLRTQSYSKVLLNEMAEKLPEGYAFTALDIGALPHYNQDLESGDLPVSVVAFRETITHSDAVFITLPEYNHGMPGVLKNALDWLSRPAFASCMMHKPVLFASESEGALGGVRSLYQMRETLSSMLCYLPPMPEIVITHVNTKIIDGRLQDSGTQQFLQKSVDRFLQVTLQK